MVTGADAHAVHVHDARDVVRVDALDVKAHDAVVVIPIDGADDLDKVELHEFAHQVMDECLLAGLDVLIAHGVDQVVEGRAGGENAGGVLRAGLELLGDGRPDGVLLGDRIDHLAAGEHGRHGVEQVHLAPQHADAHGAHGLVCAKGKEVGAQVGHVNRHVRQRLCAVDDQVATVLVHELAEVLDRVLDAQHVGDLAHGQNLGLGAHLGKNFLGGELTGLGGVEVDELGTGLAADLLPRNQVGVMLHDGDDDLVAGLQHRGRKALGDQVERLTGVAGEDDLVGLGGADEVGDLLADLGDGVGGLDGQRVQAAQRVGVHALVEVALGVEYAGGALRGSGAIEEGDLGVLLEQRELALVGVGLDVHGRPAARSLVAGIELHGLGGGAGIAFNVLGVDHASSSSKLSIRLLPRRTTAARVRSSAAESAASSSLARMNRSSAAFWSRPRQAR